MPAERAARPAPPAAKEGSWVPTAGRYLYAALWVGLLGGAAVGAAAGGALARLPSLDLLLAEPGRQRLAILFFTAFLALVGAGLTAVAGLACALLARFFPVVRERYRPWRFAAAAFGVAAVALALFFEVAFEVVRDLRTPLGAAVAVGFLGGPLLLLALLGRSRRAPRDAGPRRLGIALLAILLVIAVVTSLRALPVLAAAEARPGPVAPRGAGVSDPSGGVAEPSGPRPRVGRVILVSIDTLRADHLGLYGYARDTAPHLAALAADGVVFEEAHSQAPWTLPSHGSMFTGLYPWTHGACFSDNLRFLNSETADRLADSNLTLAEMVAAHGFRTAGFASMKWFGKTFNLTQGFQVFQMNTTRFFANVIADKGIGWVRAAGDDPYFLFLHFFDVHEYKAPEEYFRRFYEGDYHGKTRGREKRTMGNLWQSLSPDDLRYLEAKYDGAIAWVDHELGRFFTELRERGLYDDALIIVTADHGEEFLDHGGTGHGFFLYDDNLHVPLIVKPPRGAPIAAPRSASWAGSVDIVPTVLDYLGLAAPSVLAGTSLVPAIEGRPLPPRRLYAGCSLLQNTYAVLAGPEKYIGNRFPPFGLFRLERWLPDLRTFYAFRPPELYDLSVDPQEKDNLVGRDPDDGRRLRGALFAELARHRRTGETFELDPETIEQLKALGYLR